MAGSFKYVPPDEVARRHQTTPVPSPRPASTARRPGRAESQQRNVEAVLSLGDTRFITYRHRTYRIPPVPFKLGQRVLDLHIKSLADAKQVAMTGEAAPMTAFYQKMDRIARLLWTHVRPIGKVRRCVWRLGLLHNPFRAASEAELKAVTDFFLQGRMMSSVRSISDQEAQA